MSAATAATHSSASPRLAPSSELRSGITSAQDWLSQTARPSHTCRNWSPPNPDRPDGREFCPYYKITWREATAEPLSSRFARVRVRAAHRDYWLAESRPEEWLLIEWPEGEEAPTKYWFSTLPANIAFHQLVDTAKLRWRIERDYQELKQEVGLGHFEGRGWRGFHHHATLCIAAYGFLVSERETIPPSGARSTRLFKETTIPETYRPRGSAIAA